MKRKYTKEEVDEAYESLNANQSFIKTVVGASLGSVIGIGIYIVFAMLGATFVVLLFLPPLIIGFLSGYLGKPFDLKLQIIPCLIGMAVYFIGLYWIFIAHNYMLILLTPVAGLMSMYCSKLHINEIQKYAIWKKQYE